jgi:hypothetical protein
MQQGLFEVERELSSLQHLGTIIFGFNEDKEKHEDRKVELPMSFKDCFTTYSSISQLVTAIQAFYHRFKVCLANPLATYEDVQRAIDFVMF